MSGIRAASAVGVLALLISACPSTIVVIGDAGFGNHDGGSSIDQDATPSGGDARADAGTNPGEDVGPHDAGGRDASPLDAVVLDAENNLDVGRADDPAADALAADAPAADATPADAAALDAVPAEAGLDPDLALPNGNGTPCTNPGTRNECGGLEVCRFYSPTEGRCESCTTCGTLNDDCVKSEECDILFDCYLGRCTNFCTLGQVKCGTVEECIDVGYPNKGVCLPH